MARPRLLVTGFGPFPGTPENPTETLVRALAKEAPETFGAGALKAVVLPTEYRRSWQMLRRVHASFAPHVVVHFGLSEGIDAIHLECVARNRVDPKKPDAAGYAPASGLVRRSGQNTLNSTLPADAILSASRKAGFPAALSDDAGDYVCNATLYRSLFVAPPDRRVGLVHVPPLGKGEYDRQRLIEAGMVLLQATLADHAVA